MPAISNGLERLDCCGSYWPIGRLCRVSRADARNDETPCFQGVSEVPRGGIEPSTRGFSIQATKAKESRDSKWLRKLRE